MATMANEFVLLDHFYKESSKEAGYHFYKESSKEAGYHFHFPGKTRS
jgi:hypothetical protein